jgi:hypothetical protein
MDNSLRLSKMMEIWGVIRSFELIPPKTQQKRRKGNKVAELIRILLSPPENSAHKC